MTNFRPALAFFYYVECWMSQILDSIWLGRKSFFIKVSRNVALDWSRWLTTWENLRRSWSAEWVFGREIVNSESMYFLNTNFVYCFGKLAYTVDNLKVNILILKAILLADRGQMMQHQDHKKVLTSWNPQILCLEETSLFVCACKWKGTVSQLSRELLVRFSIAFWVWRWRWHLTWFHAYPRILPS